MKVRILNRPTGCVNGQPWPEVGDTMDLSDSAGGDLAAAGWVEIVKAEKPAVEKRPAATKAETRKA